MADRTQGAVRAGAREDQAPSGNAAARGGVPAGSPTTQEISPAPATSAMGSAPAGRTGSAPAQGAAASGRSPLSGAEQPSDGGRTGRPGKGASNRGPRRARLQLRNIDTWSALKISLVLSIAFFFVWMVAVGLLYGVLSQLGVFDTVNDILGQLSTASGNEATGELITPRIVFGGAAVIGGINVILLTALFTIGTLMYNLCSDLVGGLEVTLSERD